MIVYLFSFQRSVSEIDYQFRFLAKCFVSHSQVQMLPGLLPLVNGFVEKK